MEHTWNLPTFKRFQRVSSFKNLLIDYHSLLRCVRSNSKLCKFISLLQLTASLVFASLKLYFFTILLSCQTVWQFL